MLMLKLRSREPTGAENLRKARPALEDLALRIERDAQVFKPSGDRLMLLCRGALSQGSADAAYPLLHDLRKHKTGNRPSYTGDTGTHQNNVRKDGVRSRTNRVRRDLEVSSNILGFFDRSPRFPFCRESAFSKQNHEQWGACRPLIQEVATLFAEHIPERQRAQAEAAERTHPAYVIPGTPFTTLTVNNTIAAAYHRDAGDYKPGFGVMCVLRRGEYTGGDLVLPAYGVGVDLQDRDVIFFDVHELHGNLPILGVGEASEPEKGGYERISVVFYFREKMVDCLSPAEELERAKRLRGGDLRGAAR